jgi:hypothetical protein
MLLMSTFDVCDQHNCERASRTCPWWPGTCYRAVNRIAARPSRRTHGVSHSRYRATDARPLQCFFTILKKKECLKKLIVRAINLSFYLNEEFTTALWYDLEALREGCRPWFWHVIWSWMHESWLQKICFISPAPWHSANFWGLNAARTQQNKWCKNRY